METALHILVMNVEAFSTDKGRKFAGKFVASHNALMAVDESTTIKTPSARRTKNIIAVGKEAKYKEYLQVHLSQRILLIYIVNVSSLIRGYWTLHHTTRFVIVMQK